jgi:carbamoyltransferase
MSNIVGLSFGFHDAAACLIDNGEILFAGHSERYTKKKHDKELSYSLIDDLKSYTTGPISTIAYYENPWLKDLRRLVTGEYVYKDPVPVTKTIKSHFDTRWYKTYSHHKSHAAAGFATSPFESAAVLVIDAIGEFDTVSIWKAWVGVNGHCHYRKIDSIKYPHSLGLTYSAFTDRVGLKPMDEEYILMGMAAYGKPNFANRIKNEIINVNKVKFKNIKNCHTGLGNWPFEGASHEDLAASIQQVTEDAVARLADYALTITQETNLVYMGGVALNCVANSRLGSLGNIWIMPCPGDAGSSLGAAALAYGKKLNWQNAYLGHNIGSNYPVQKLFNALLSKQIVGVASGRAEFGPRALGNRSLLADPRGHDIKDRVNEIKRRQKFRPFAPAILAEMADQYFDMPPGWHHSPYMQSVARCRQPDLTPAICHADGTSRVQTVEADGSGLRQLLELWYKQTGCPMLLNTSLNIRWEPMVNDRYDADRFEQKYGVHVFS